ncbi:TetR/AcrR family transcriptional regulator C-terminal domain-containing protein [Streptomyces sp. DSM 15324]|uniref:TetR/AcrR family transcriptional regulator C-terminal domain-containing protein n=1 Tax=Streptomyces sp. DSM 15324 TaxID=1739111 RepID=UPI00074AC7CB|nr:TetR/AcrR family transcriptional regulator C-terminal domain-containing protein [Streptomyces sp. DSM 15324]KUO14082.1 TetR family transcriptional regulator [Streptomyces sp. DSM 15324]
MVEIGTQGGSVAQQRAPLSRKRVLDTAVALADEGGVDALSMRRIAQALGVVPMALYKHVAHKNALLDGMIDALVAEIDPPSPDADWKTAVRGRVLSARRMLLRHPWAPGVIEARMKARATPTPAVLAYLDSMIGIFRAGGFPVDLVHHAMHVMGSRLLGFSQELFEDRTDRVPDPDAPSPEEMAARYPHLTELARAVAHDEASVVGSGCDDQYEFEFALDLTLDGLERLLRTA